MELVLKGGNAGFHQGDGTCKGRKEKHQEEGDADNSSGSHAGENFRQGNESQGRTGLEGFHISAGEGKYGRNDHHAQTTVYCQWDSDRNINGNAINRAAIQIGLKRNTLREFLDTGICRIEDLTPLVKKWNEQRKNGKLNSKNLPVERIYPVKDKTIRNRLNMTYGSVKKA